MRVRTTRHPVPGNCNSHGEVSVKSASGNKIYVGDNLDVMHGMNSGSVDLIYLDPPFNSKRIYAAPIGSSADKKAAAKGKTAGFDDIWNWNDDVDIRLESFYDDHTDLFDYIQTAGRIHGLPMKAYLTFMAQRIIEMHRVLKDTGSLYLHCDPTASHYLKIILDYVFQRHNFRNEILWCYTGPARRQKRFARKNDCIFFYTKSENNTFNVQRVPFDKATLARRKYSETKKGGIKFKGMTKAALDEGKAISNWWADIPSGGQISRNELTGYPTQKPLALLDRIIKASSNEGDLVLDPFCGCATTCVAAQNLHRQWIGIDVSEVAADLVADRLSEDTNKSGSGQRLMFSDFTAHKTPPVRTDQQKLTWSKPKIRAHFYGEQNGNCKGCGTHFESARHFHIDHIYPKSKGGAWVVENLQLLCGSCNSIKGNKPMEYLRAHIKNRQAQHAFF